jgi:hypothetical protein
MKGPPNREPSVSRREASRPREQRARDMIAEVAPGRPTDPSSTGVNLSVGSASVMG